MFVCQPGPFQVRVIVAALCYLSDKLCWNVTFEYRNVDGSLMPKAIPASCPQDFLDTDIELEKKMTVLVVLNESSRCNFLPTKKRPAVQQAFFLGGHIMVLPKCSPSPFSRSFNRPPSTS